MTPPVSYDDMRGLVHAANAAGENTPVVHARMLGDIRAAEENGDPVPGFIDLLDRARNRDVAVRDAIDVVSRLAFVREGQQLTRLERDIVDYALGVLGHVGRQPIGVT